MKTFTNFLAGFFLGGLLGAAVALLLTPSSGEELRTRVQSEVGRVQAEVQKAAQDRRIELEEQLSALRSPRRPEQE